MTSFTVHRPSVASKDVIFRAYVYAYFVIALCYFVFCFFFFCFFFLFFFVFWWSYSEGGQLTVVNLNALARGHGGIALCYVVTVATLPHYPSLCPLVVVMSHFDLAHHCRSKLSTSVASFIQRNYNASFRCELDFKTRA